MAAVVQIARLLAPLHGYGLARRLRHLLHRSPERQGNRMMIGAYRSVVIPDGSRKGADPGPKYPGIRRKGAAGSLDPGSRACRHWAGMTMERPCMPYAIALPDGRGIEQAARGNRI
jgi:hypothetical protein